MILVTGATGNVGSAVVSELRAGGHDVRALVRDPERAARIPDGVDIAVGSFDAPDTIARAMVDVASVFLSSGDSPAKVAHETAVIDGARAAGARRIVKLSTQHAHAGSLLPPFDWHGQIEGYLSSASIPSVTLRAAFMMTNLFMVADAVRAGGQLPAPAEGAKIAMIDPRDVAAVAAVALTGETYEGQTLELTGPEGVTYDDAAEALTRALGRRVTFVPVPDEALRGELLTAGMPDWLVTHLGHLFPLLRSGAMGQPTDTVRLVTGVAPRSLSTFLTDHARVFGG